MKRNECFWFVTICLGVTINGTQGYKAAGIIPQYIPNKMVPIEGSNVVEPNNKNANAARKCPPVATCSYAIE